MHITFTKTILKCYNGIKNNNNNSENNIDNDIDTTIVNNN